MFDRRKPSENHYMRVVTDNGDYFFNLCNRFQDMLPGKTYLWHRLGDHIPSRMRQKVYVPRGEFPDHAWEAIVTEAREGGEDVIAITVISNNGYVLVFENLLGEGLAELEYRTGGPPRTPIQPKLLE
jgi:hypothetical protein